MFVQNDAENPKLEKHGDYLLLKCVHVQHVRKNKCAGRSHGKHTGVTLLGSPSAVM